MSLLSCLVRAQHAKPITNLTLIQVTRNESKPLGYDCIDRSATGRNEGCFFWSTRANAPEYFAHSQSQTTCSFFYPPLPSFTHPFLLPPLSFCFASLCTMFCSSRIGEVQLGHACNTMWSLSCIVCICILYSLSWVIHTFQRIWTQAVGVKRYISAWSVANGPSTNLPQVSKRNLR